MSSTEYVEFEHTISLNFDKIRDLQWRSVDDFADYIRDNAPVGEICGVHGIGYACKEHEYDQQTLQLVIVTRRPKVDVEREKAEQEALRKKQAELAAIAAAKQARIDEIKKLRRRVETLQTKLADNARELTAHLEENTDVLGIETKGE